MNSIKLFLGVLQGFYPFEQGEVKTGGDCMMIDVDGDKGVDDDTVLRR